MFAICMLNIGKRFLLIIINIKNYKLIWNLSTNNFPAKDFERTLGLFTSMLYTIIFFILNWLQNLGITFSSWLQIPRSWYFHPAQYISISRLVSRKHQHIIIKRSKERIFTLSVSTSSITSSIVASSPIPYSDMACLNSSLVINLWKMSSSSSIMLLTFWLGVKTYCTPDLSREN